MSIVTEIERIKSNIANAYTACEEKGATMPSVLNSANLFDCIASITGGAVPTKLLTYYGKGTSLTSARRYGAGASIGGNALIGGGTSGNATSSVGLSTVEVYTSTLTKTVAPNLTNGTRLLRAVSTEKHAIFAGGSTTGEYNTAKNTVDAYDKDLVKTTATNLSIARCWWMDASEKVGEYALFGDGYDASRKINAIIDAYDSNLTRTTIGEGTAEYLTVGTTAIGDYALFPRYGDSLMDTYDKNLVKGTASALSVDRSAVIAVSNNKHAIFAGGSLNSSGSSTASNVVDVYDKNLVKGTATKLDTARYYGIGIKLGEYAIIAGGATANSAGSETSAVEAFNDNLVKIIEHNIQYGVRYLTGAVAGDKFAITAGGQYDSITNATKYTDIFELVG